MPPHERIIVPKRRPNNASIPVAKQRQTWQNTGLALPDPLIRLLGRPGRGHQHDSSLGKHELPPALDGLADLNGRVALGYLGMQTDDTGDRLDRPPTQSRKRKKHPTPQGSDAPKAAKTAWRQVRIFIEHAMGGMKRSTILGQVFRNRKAAFEDAAIGICAGLWNFALSS